jgi:site-specific recombinase XerD
MNISIAINEYLHSVKLTRSHATMLAYKNALQIFSQILKEKRIDPSISDTQDITENIISPYRERQQTSGSG